MSPDPVMCAAFCLEDTVSQVHMFTLSPLKLEPSPSLWSPSGENMGGRSARTHCPVNLSNPTVMRLIAGPCDRVKV